MARVPKGNTYHHGDARATLIRAAEELLSEVGAAGLSLRGVAERAGLSRQAPYNHFVDKEALLAAVAIIGFEQLEAAVRTETVGLVGEVALVASAEAYIATAQRSPHLFRLMFSRELVDVKKFEDTALASKRAYAAMVEVICTFCPAAQVSDLSLVAWCIVHGYACLCNEAGIEGPELRRARAQLFASVIRSSVVAGQNIT